jgi:hypothetical protein
MLALSLFTLAVAFVASALPAQKRAKAQLVTKCTVSNTVALTFVSYVNVGLRCVN